LNVRRHHSIHDMHFLAHRSGLLVPTFDSCMYSPSLRRARHFPFGGRAMLIFLYCLITISLQSHRRRIPTSPMPRHSRATPFVHFCFVLILRPVSALFHHVRCKRYPTCSAFLLCVFARDLCDPRWPAAPCDDETARRQPYTGYEAAADAARTVLQMMQWNRFFIEWLLM